MYNIPKISIQVFDDAIVIKNKNNLRKQFPRCGITKIEPFVLEMLERGKLDDLLY